LTIKAKAEEGAEPFKFPACRARAVFPRRAEAAQLRQIELREHRQSAILAVGFHLAFK
jgi:hypothetical protein